MKSYTHFTSPIRRYPDLIVHRILREVLGGGLKQEVEFDLGSKHAIKRLASLAGPLLDEEREVELRSALEVIGDHSSERERTAADAERELMDWRKAEFMADRVGDEFGGIITSVKEYGFYVELNEFFIEGLVHISTLAGVYDYQERKHRLVAERTKRTFRLGDEVRVVVNRVDCVRHLIDFSIA